MVAQADIYGRLATGEGVPALVTIVTGDLRFRGGITGGGDPISVEPPGTRRWRLDGRGRQSKREEAVDGVEGCLVH